MKFYSHYYWESKDGDNPVSIVLQQVKLKKGHCLMACICDGSKSHSREGIVSGYFTERLVEWFHHKLIPVLLKGLQERLVLHMLTEEMKSIEEELSKYGKQKEFVAVYDIMGMVLYEHNFWCFWKGEGKGYLFNKRFNKRQRRELKEILYQTDEGDGIQLQQGNLQKGIGVLLCSTMYDNKILKEEMMEVLSEENLKDKDIERRLRELWIENQRRGTKGNVGAVFFRSE